MSLLLLLPALVVPLLHLLQLFGWGGGLDLGCTPLAGLPGLRSGLRSIVVMCIFLSRLSHRRLLRQVPAILLLTPLVLQNAIRGSAHLLVRVLFLTLLPVLACTVVLAVSLHCSGAVLCEVAIVLLIFIVSCVMLDVNMLVFDVRL